MLDANATVEWTPAFYSKRMDDWLRNMGDWNISRKRYFGLPLPFYPCDECETLTVVGSRRELEERALSGLDQLKELHRPWIDEVPIACSGCGAEVRRVPEVGDAWLDAGIVPLSTLGWQNPEFVPEGYATGAGRGVTKADLPDHALLGAVVPGRLDLGDARADPALVLLHLVHVADARRALAVRARAHVREAARRDGARDAPLLGQLDRRRRRVHADGRRRHAAPVHVAAAEPEPALRLRPRTGDRAPPAHVLELRALPRRLREHRGLAAHLRRSRGRARGRAPAARPLARRADERARPRDDRCVRELPHRERRSRVRRLRRGSLELVHPPLAAPLLGRRRGRVPHALVRARPEPPRRRADHAFPQRPPLADARDTRGRSARVRPSRGLAGHRPPRTRLCSPRSPSSAASSISGARPARASASRSASRSARSSSRARRSRRGTSTRSRRSYASATWSSGRSRRASST